MDLRPLGNTGLSVSPIGLGTVKLGRNRAVKYPGAENAALPTDEQVLDLFCTSAELGVTLIDTAPAYGDSEERIGAIMSANNWFGGRDRWVVCTKAGEEFDADTGESRYDFSERHIRASVERSLRRLRIDTLDIVLIHSDGHDEWIINSTGALDTLRHMQRQGLIRAVGISTKSVDGGLLAARRSEGACDVVMVAYNPAEKAQGVVIDAARHRGVGILIKKALASGHVGDLMARMPPDIRAATSDPVEAALRFTLPRAGVSSVVLGTSSPTHLRHNIAAAERAIATCAL